VGRGPGPRAPAVVVEGVGQVTGKAQVPGGAARGPGPGPRGGGGEMRVMLEDDY